MTTERAERLLTYALSGNAGENALRAEATKQEYDAARCLGHIYRLKRVLSKTHRTVAADKQLERAAELQQTAGKLASLIGFTPTREILAKMGVEV